MTHRDDTPHEGIDPFAALVESFHGPDTTGVVQTDERNETLFLADGLTQIELFCAALAEKAERRYVYAYDSPHDARGMSIRIEEEIEVDPDHLAQLQTTALEDMEEFSCAVIQTEIAMLDQHGVPRILITDRPQTEMPDAYDFHDSFTNFPIFPVEEAGLTLFEISQTIRSMDGKDIFHDAELSKYAIDRAHHFLDTEPTTLLEIIEVGYRELADIGIQYYRESTLARESLHPQEPDDIVEQFIVVDGSTHVYYTLVTLRDGTHRLWSYGFDPQQGEITTDRNSDAAVDPELLKKMLELLEPAWLLRDGDGNDT